MIARTRRARVLAALISVVVASSGCSLGTINAAHLPGGVSLGPHPLHVAIQFADVLDLVPGSFVKVNNVAVGEVEAISLVGWYAKVEVAIRDDVELPGNTIAQLLQTSLLGEQYVALSPPPARPSRGRLTDGAMITIAATSTNPSVEQILGAISLVLTGGAFTQLQRIVTELNQALGDGRAPAVRDLIGRLQTLSAGLDQQKAGLVAAIRNMKELASAVAAQDRVLSASLQTLPPAVAVLSQQTQQLVAMLTSLNNLSSVATRVVNAGSADFAAELHDLDPVLTQLAAAGDALPNALKVVGTFPLPSTIGSAVRGDYVNGNMTATPDASNVLTDIMVHAAQKGTVQQPKYAGALDPQLPPVPGACGLPYPQPAKGGNGC